MSLPNDIILVRHGESEGNLAYRQSRRGDDSAFTEEFRSRHGSLWRLTDKGRVQARMAGTWIRENISDRFDRYYVSEYIRAQETAALLGLSDAVWYRDFYLRERDWGDLELKTQIERAERFGEALKRRESDTFFWCPPNGESLAQLCLRIDRVLHTLHRECEGKRVIIVCHGEVMWAFRVRLERMTQRKFRELEYSADIKDRILNTQILHYTRCDPDSGDVAPYAQWMRSVCPTDLSLSRNVWECIERPTFSNEDLFAEVSLVTPMLK